MKDKASLTLIGCGAMGSALLQGFLQTDFFSRIYVITPRACSLDPFKGDARLTWLTPSAPIPQTELYLFAVKPGLLNSLLPLYSSNIKPDAYILSVAAAKPLSFYKRHFSSSHKVVRLMPNTPCRIGKGIILGLGAVQESERRHLATLLSSVGIVKWIEDESLFERLSTLTGCGPGFIYYFIECLSMAAQKIGIAAPQAASLTQQLFEGSIAYLTACQMTPEALRLEVTSPGGTTAAGLAVLREEDRLQTLLTQMLEASLHRTHKMQQDEA